jgi:hypothetical protein
MGTTHPPSPRANRQLMNPRPRLATLLLLVCFVGLVNHWIMRMDSALSKTSRVEICNNTNLPAILPSQVLPTCESLMKSPNSPVADGAFLTRDHPQRLDPASGWLSRVESPIYLPPQTVYIVRSTSVLVQQTSCFHW